MRRHLWRFGLVTLLLLSLVLSVSQPLTAQAASMAEILGQLEKIPHDPNLLGAGPARTRIKEFSAPFVRKEFKGLDGTPLAAAMAIHQDGKPRPGVVLAHGFTGSKNQNYLVERTPDTVWQLLRQLSDFISLKNRHCELWGNRPS